MNPSPADAARELLRRRQARRSLIDFATYTIRGYQVDPFHRCIANALDRTLVEPDSRTMILAPPQNGKSLLASCSFPPYALGRFPERPILLASYAATLAQKMSRAARTTLESQEFGYLFPEVKISADSRAVNNWQLDGHRGEMLAAGVGGPFPGHGGMIGCIDDPFENWEAAQSKVIRDKVWDWYRGVFVPRIWEGGSIILIMTPWHPDDLSGRLMKEGGWRVVRLPAIAETQEERDAAAKAFGLPLGRPDPLGRSPGDPVAPSRFGRDALDLKKREAGPLAWQAEYQCFPQEAEGSIFKRLWFARRFSNRGDHFLVPGRAGVVLLGDCTVFAVLDPAGGTSEGSDHSAAGVFAVTPHGDLLILYMERERTEIENVLPWFQDICRAWQVSVSACESDFLQSRIAREGRKQGMNIRQLLTKGKSKFVRAYPAVNLCSQGGCFLPDSRDEWIDDFLDEAAAFTGSGEDARDDEIDCLAWAVYLRDEIIGPPGGSGGSGAAVLGRARR